MPIIRQITSADIPVIAGIESEVHAHPWTEGMFTDCLDSRGFVLENNGIICAYIIIQIILDECHILTIGVKKIYQHQGYATQLLDNIINNYSAICQRILLEVSALNHPAIQLYQKLEFQHIAVRKNYYAASEDAFIFEKILY